LGSPHNPSRMLPGISPPREPSDFLPTSELRLPGMNEGFFSGPANDSVRGQNIFGMTDSTRGIITAKSLLDLLAQHVSKNETRGRGYARYARYARSPRCSFFSSTATKLVDTSTENLLRTVYTCQKKLCRKNLELVIPMRYARSSPMRSARSVHSLPSKTV
jgi:hypothetical protein